MAESDDGSGGSHLDPGGQEVTCSQISGSPLDPGGQEEVICFQISVGAVS